jgi:N-acetylmuramoyl-L-alanine amidase
MGGRLRLAEGAPRDDLGTVFACILAVFAVLLLCAMPANAAEPLSARDFRIAGDETKTRIVIDFSAEPDLRWLLLRGPHRLVIELPETRFALDPSLLRAHGLIRTIDHGRAGEGARIVIATKGPFVVDRAEVVPNGPGEGARLSLDLVAAGDAAFEAALAEQALTTAATVNPDKSGRVPSNGGAAEERFTIVIDPGHGGDDGGARGIGGSVEKDVTLAFAQQLAGALRSAGRYDVRLTRESDVFLRLDERVRIARQLDADLFISVHADTIRYKNIRGATVYTVSDTASDAEAQALADRENLSDRLAGIEIPDENHEVADILVDLIRRETHAFSVSFARTLVGELGETVGLINNPHRFARFRVLKAPDVPSVLVELGYLSNEKDEAQLLDPEWRTRAVGSITSAISQFAASRAAGR